MTRAMTRAKTAHKSRTKSGIYAALIGLFSLGGVGAIAPVAADPARWSPAWPDTDFSITEVDDWREILSGGPGKDGIPAIDEPRFIAVRDEQRLDDLEPVLTVSIDGDARAYPIRYLMWHEIVNDTVAGVPVAVTYCPLCNSAMVFDRRVTSPATGREDVLDFGVSGLLRHSDMVMYDRQTESWWQQAVGKGIVGAMTGTQLTQLPAWMESWARFKQANPTGEVMDAPPWSRQYGQNPYAGYDRAEKPFLYNGENPPHGIAPLMRVVRVGARAWTLERIAMEGEISQAGVHLSWAAGQSSALDHAVISQGRDVGNIRVRDAQGADVPHDVMFAFAFHAFYPDGVWMLE